ncbi:flagellar protein FliT [Alloalcanivorax xenomutans]|jgi:flagellar protein FliT|uniref:Flagellar protein FliT n=1 Tax=Alloalcanivorax xenomutans TaxID=1094342 RepID=A0A9Q3W707_9GAMM|nr:flagellar protein FliT [Alloalcanivorax xenomutans]KYZ87389.1 flagellar protein [Alcanivorax sp. KX64203]MBA4720343.1 flagellar protein FliT [Alcanivorax sp.]ARB46722.1 flagellar protein [Alloalcanivorax xenomutans]MCE7509976.1 flagellar protein FliT [Alloalcanivorax xenomutans]MCE7522634.1 flagellar protein FliT [Alloalcanivorax xenomutans]|tara:strand:- start:454 stop:870 length:417 start_codon:yes stop_codon:yes gene_type:complete
MSNQNTDTVPTPEGVLVSYETLLARSTRMLACVRQKDWDALVDEQSRYVLEVDRLSRIERDLSFNVEEQERKAALLERILEQDLEVRRCLMARRDELDQLLGTSRRRQDLHRTYQSHSAQVVDGRARFHRDPLLKGTP